MTVTVLRSGLTTNALTRASNWLFARLRAPRECHDLRDYDEGLQNAALPKPDQVWLLSQVRRATINDQRALLGWLAEKFRVSVSPKN